MLVKKWMSKEVVSVGPHDTVIKAQILLKENNIKRLPVMDKGKLVGIVTEHQLRRMLLSETLKVKDLMTKDPVTVPEDFTLGEAAEILLKHNISGLPVVDNQNQVVGIIAKSDLFKLLVPLTGAGGKGIQFALNVPNRIGAIKEITDIIRTHGGRLMNVLTSYDEAPEGYLRIYIRMYGINRNKLQKLREILSEKASFIYMVDHRHNKRDIYEM